MRDEEYGDSAQNGEKAGQRVVAAHGRGRSDTVDEEYMLQPLTQLSFDTILTAGDIKRLMKIVSVI